MTDWAGQRIWAELCQQVEQQVERFNKLTKRRILELRRGNIPRENQVIDPDIQVLRHDARTSPLQVEYDSAPHRIRWKCGAGNGEYILTTGRGESAYFETPYHAAISVEEMVKEMLSKLMESTF